VVTMKNVVVWDVVPCGSCKKRRFFARVLQLLVTANVVPSSLILFILMTEAIRSPETSVLTRVPRRHIREDGILQAFPLCYAQKAFRRLRCINR
jgi:hypothetical protein